MNQNVLDLLTSFISGYTTKILSLESAPTQLPQKNRGRVPTESNQVLVTKLENVLTYCQPLR
jgi:hypothetical protein